MLGHASRTKAKTITAVERIKTKLSNFKISIVIKYRYFYCLVSCINTGRISTPPNSKLTTVPTVGKIIWVIQHHHLSHIVTFNWKWVNENFPFSSSSNDLGSCSGVNVIKI